MAYIDISSVYIDIQGEDISAEIKANGFPSKENGAYPITSDELNFFYGTAYKLFRNNMATFRERLAVDVDMDSVVDTGTYITALITSDECNKELPHEYSMKNYPSNLGGMVFVSNYKTFVESDIIMQKVIDYSGAEWNRVKAGGQWCEWKRIDNPIPKVYRAKEAQTIILPTLPVDLTELVIFHNGGDFTVTVKSEDTNAKIMGVQEEIILIDKISYTRFIYNAEDNDWYIVRGDM